MKKILLFLFSICLTASVYATDPTVSFDCSGGGTACTFAEPCVASSYSAIINDGDYSDGNVYTKTITWSALPLNSFTNESGQNTSLYSLNWNNTATSRSISVTVSYSKSGVNQKTISAPAKTVTIKYIGAIVSMSITGDFTASPAGGSTTNVPCGQQNLTISIPTPATNPTSAITYTWILPSGWSGSSTSNSINVTTSSSDAGTLIVQAKRNDSQCYIQYGFTVTRPLAQPPSIAAISPANDNAICTGESKVYSASGVNATSYRWDVPSSVNTFTYSNNIVIQPSSSFTLSAYSKNGCGENATPAIYNVYYGPPTIATATVNGGSQQSPNYGSNPFLLNINTNTAEPGITYNWTTLQGTANIYYNGNNSVAAYVYPFARIQGAITNRCGTGSTVFYLYNQSNGFYAMSSPNPATNTISANIKAMTVLKSINLVSHTKASVVRTFDVTRTADSKTHKDVSDNISFDVDDLPRGLYYLNFSFQGNKNFTEQIELH